MAWTTSDRVMKIREKNRYFDIFAEMMDGWRRHLSGRNASLLAFFSFLSIFPLLLAAITILGIVLDGRPDLQEDIVQGAAAEIPVLGPQIAEDPRSLDGSIWVLILGLAGALFSSTKAFMGLQSALDDTWEVHVDDRANGLVQRGKAIVGLVILGGAQVASLVIASIVSEAGFPAIGNLALILGTIAINIIVIGLMYRLLTSYSPTFKQVLPGAIIAGIVFTGLQNFGVDLVRRFAEGSASIAVIATVLGLISWLSLVGITLIMSAELNAALHRLGDGHNVPDSDEMHIPIRA